MCTLMLGWSYSDMKKATKECVDTRRISACIIEELVGSIRFFQRQGILIISKARVVRLPTTRYC